MNVKKCETCPLLTDSRSCPGEKSKFVCSQSHQPGLIAQLRSFAVAVVEHVAAGMPMATEAPKNARLAVCRACEYYDAGRCRVCTCHMDIKADWAEQGCPIGKWGPVAAEEGGVADG